MKPIKSSKLGLSRKLFFCLIGLSIAQTVNASNPSLLSPPWYLLQAKLSATLRADPCVHVSNLEGEGLDMKIKIEVCDYDKALALAAFLNKKHGFGEKLAVTTQVYAPTSLPVFANLPTSAEETAQVLNRALSGNTNFVKAGADKYSVVAYVEFKPAVVQYFSDDISDFYHNTNLLASTAFREVLGLNPFSRNTVRVYATTSRMN